MHGEQNSIKGNAHEGCKQAKREIIFSRNKDLQNIIGTESKEYMYSCKIVLNVGNYLTNRTATNGSEHPEALLIRTRNVLLDIVRKIPSDNNLLLVG